MTDQTHVQTVKLYDLSTAMCGGLDGALLLSSTKVAALVLPPLDLQISELLSLARDKEAIALWMRNSRDVTGAALTAKLRRCVYISRTYIHTHE